jgi:hydroxyacylglutathione hydrolase
VTETHIHADFVSGARELAQRTGARLHLSRAGDPEWGYRYPDESAVCWLADGSSIEVGRVGLRVLHVPGHTPEHLAFLVSDREQGGEPMGALTGDFVFVGDVGRPDLLEKAAGVTGTMEASARALFESLQRFRELPDYLQVWPGHGAGSACGKALGAVPQTTVGYEKLFNPALAPKSPQEFIEFILSGQPDPPKYFATMKRLNRDGPPLLNELPQPKQLAARELEGRQQSDTLIVDTRAAASFAKGHVPGAVNIQPVVHHVGGLAHTIRSRLRDYRR